MIKTNPFILFVSFLFIVLAGCKERNELYPPPPWANYFFEKPGILSRPVTAIFETNDHYTWFGSQDNKGLLFNDGYGWKQFDLTSTGINFDSVTAIVQDGNGLTWIAWKAGLATYNGTSFNVIPQFEGMKVTSVCVQGIGIVWIGLDGNQQTGGLAKYENGNWTFYHPAPGDLPSSHIRSLAFDFDQQLWIGTSDHGVIRYNGHSWTEYSSAWLGSDPGTINSLAVDTAGIVWAGTSTSCLLKFSNAGASILNSGTLKPINSIVASHDGTIWMGTGGAGILTYRNGKWTGYTSSNAYLPVDNVLTMSVNKGGKILSSLSDGHVIYFK
ncbi:MAG: hypothetical protein HXX13_17120 [Bacteroidetes bacterium]|nr:hypothetical protein [Bacteroidota bacterium]